jgi:hypothetical protein
MKITVDLTEAEAKKLDQWIAPQVKPETLRGCPIEKRLKFDVFIAYKVWLAWKNHEYIDESNNTATTKEHSN